VWWSSAKARHATLGTKDKKQFELLKSAAGSEAPQCQKTKTPSFAAAMPGTPRHSAPSGVPQAAGFA